jgi:hypothetical protein|uniref:Uncharacterized protein n=1 Tax=Myoviridae sp. ctYA416 TaxID=2825125 RepID=A0A8S5UTI7_9CAUD|nr:MAG TPA: hypothetical protein [Myoviridae sp. ctYA416]
MLEFMKKYLLAQMIVYWSIPLIIYVIIDIAARLTGRTDVMPVFILLVVFTEFIITIVLLIGKLLDAIYGDKR